MFSQLLVHERAGDYFRLLRAEQVRDILWQVFTQKGSGELRVAQGLLEKPAMKVGELICHFDMCRGLPTREHSNRKFYGREAYISGK